MSHLDEFNDEERSYIRSVAQNQPLFNEYLVADIVRRQRNCANHERRLTWLERWRVAFAAIEASIIAGLLWLANGAK